MTMIKKMKKILTNDKYILKGKKVVECHDLLEWGKWFGTANRIVKQDNLKNGLFVSTVFLGLNHNFLSKGKPILFETMVFTPKRKRKIFGRKMKMMIGDELDQNRYHTWAESERGHKKMVKRWKGWKK